MVIYILAYMVLGILNFIGHWNYVGGYDESDWQEVLDDVCRDHDNIRCLPEDIKAKIMKFAVSFVYVFAILFWPTVWLYDFKSFFK